MTLRIAPPGATGKACRAGEAGAIRCYPGRPAAIVRPFHSPPRPAW